MNDSRKDGSFPTRTCEEWADLLALTPEEQLVFADRVAFLQHVQSCTKCATMRATDRLLNAYARRALSVKPLPNLPSFVFEAVQIDSVLKPPEKIARPEVNNLPRRLSTLPTRQQKSRYRVRWWLVAASLTIIVIGAIALLVSPVVPSLFQGSTSNSADAASLALDRSLQSSQQPGATRARVVSWSPGTGNYIAVLWDNNTVEVLDAHTYKAICTKDVASGYGLAWSPDGRSIASVGKAANSTIEIW